MMMVGGIIPKNPMTESAQAIVPPSSLTHQHITAVVNTLLENAQHRGTVRILDLGCGNAWLLHHMMVAFEVLRPAIRFDFFGLDVSDAGQQDTGYMNEAIRYLTEHYPDLPWRERLRLIPATNRWPYSDEYFDFITNNQVMEHVFDHDFVFREIRRCLRPGGVSVNLFPLREILWEGHAHMPIVHRIRDEKLRAQLMLLFAKTGFRKRYHREMQRRGWTSLEEFARVFAHVLETDTNYISARKLLDTARRAHLHASFTYTKDFFIAKALSFMGCRPYRYRNVGYLESLAFFFGRYLSSITLLLRRIG